MTKSRQLHDRNVEARATRMTARRIAALASVAVVVAAAAFVVDSLRRSVAQLASTTTAFSVRVPRSSATGIHEPPAVTPKRAASTSAPTAIPPASGLETVVEIPADEDSAEIDGSSAAMAAGPISGTEFADLLESGAFGDAAQDPEAAAELRRALEAAEALGTDR